MDKTKPIGKRTNTTIAGYNVGENKAKPSPLEPDVVDTPKIPKEEMGVEVVVIPRPQLDEPEQPTSNMLAGMIDTKAPELDDALELGEDVSEVVEDQTDSDDTGESDEPDSVPDASEEEAAEEDDAEDPEPEDDDDDEEEEESS
jgi:hypothetical protein